MVWFLPEVFFTAIRYDLVGTDCRCTYPIRLRHGILDHEYWMLQASTISRLGILTFELSLFSMVDASL